MRRISLWFSLGAAIAVAACTQAPAPPATNPGADAATIRASSDSFLVLWNAANADALGGSLMTDAVEMWPSGIHEGRDAILQATRQFFSEFTATQTATITEVLVEGDLGLVRGNWTVTQTPKAGGATQNRTGQWFEVQRRDTDGAWKTWRWMWNETPPAAPAGGS